MKSSRRKKLFEGVTLIELLVVLAILALISSAFFVGLTQIQKARDAKRKANLEKVKIALYDYYFDHECFPEELPGCGEDFGVDGTPYLADFPCNPSGEPYVYAITSKGGGKCSQWFRLFTNLEVDSDPSIDKVHCRSGCGPDKHNCFYNYGVASTNTDVYRNCSGAYVCAPGGGEGGSCEPYEDPWVSQCPVTFSNDETCGGGLCADPANRCQNASGKQLPEE